MNKTSNFNGENFCSALKFAPEEWKNELAHTHVAVVFQKRTSAMREKSWRVCNLPDLQRPTDPMGGFLKCTKPALFSTLDQIAPVFFFQWPLMIMLDISVCLFQSLKMYWKGGRLVNWAQQPCNWGFNNSSYEFRPFDPFNWFLNVFWMAQHHRFKI